MEQWIKELYVYVYSKNYPIGRLCIIISPPIDLIRVAIDIPHWPSGRNIQDFINEIVD